MNVDAAHSLHTKSYMPCVSTGHTSSVAPECFQVFELGSGIVSREFIFIQQEGFGTRFGTKVKEGIKELDDTKWQGLIKKNHSTSGPFLFCFELIDSALGMGHDEQGYTGSLLMFVLPCFFLYLFGGLVFGVFKKLREGRWCSLRTWNRNIIFYRCSPGENLLLREHAHPPMIYQD
jgi:hypothetical protein